MKNHLAAAIISLLLLSCESKDRSFEGDNKVSITSFNKLPVVQGTLNGKKAYFILDSGASISVIDVNQQKDYGFFIEDTNEQAAGYGGNAYFYSAKGVILNIGGVNFYTDFKAQDLSVIVNVMSTQEGVKVSGIVGADIMKINKFILNFSDNSISLGK